MNGRFNKYYFRAMAFAAAVCLTFNGCGSKSSGSGSSDGTTSAQNSTSDGTGSVSDETAGGEIEGTADKAIELSTSYKHERVQLPEGLYSLYSITPTSQGVYARASVKKEDLGGDYDERIYIFSDDLMESKLITPEFPEEYNSADQSQYCAVFLENGDILMLLCMEDHGGVKEPEDPASPEAQAFNYEEYLRSCKYSYSLARFDKDGNLLKNTPLSGLEPYYNEYGLLFDSMTEYNGGVVLGLQDDTLLMIKEDGSFEELLAAPEGDDMSYSSGSNVYFKDAGGKLMISEEKYDPEDYRIYNDISYIDVENKKIGEPFIKGNEDISEAYSGAIFSNPFCTGFGDYPLCCYMASGYYGIRPDGSMELIIDWDDSDIKGAEVVRLNDGSFITVEDNWSSDMQLLHLTMRDAADLENVKIITMASLYPISDPIINEFNSSQSEYRIKKVDYSQYTSDDDLKGEGSYEQLKKDIIAGNAPDIIIARDHKTIRDLGKQGAFADLYDLMENDPEVNKDTLMPNLLQAMESDGHLYSIAPSFTIETLVTKKSACDKENWTLDDMIELYDNAPASCDRLYDRISKEEVFNMLFYCANDLIDYDNAECHFDSDDFVKMLEFCNRFVDVVDRPDKANDGWDAVQDYYSDIFYLWRNDRVLVQVMGLGEENDYGYTRDIEAGGPLNFVGYPSNDGQGGKIVLQEEYAISSSCQYKEGAWQFLRTYLTKENNKLNEDLDGSRDRYLYGYSARRDTFEEQMDQTMYFIDYMTGEKTDHAESKGETYYALSQEERDHLEEYVLGSHTLKAEFDEDIAALCLEEAAAYFAGEKTAEEAAEMIQDRAEILVSERA